LKPGSKVGCFASYWAQSKIIYEQIKKLTANSPVIQTSLAEEYIDERSWFFTFNPSESNHNGSIIKSFPLNDASKMKGTRFDTLFIDECQDIPENVFKLVLPMLSPTGGDKEKMRLLELEKDQIRRCAFLEKSEKMEVISMIEENYVKKHTNSKLVIFTTTVPAGYIETLYAKYMCSDNNFTFCNIIPRHYGKRL
jgi:hypothetical protein